jgi:hypothetical protein
MINRVIGGSGVGGLLSYVLHDKAKSEDEAKPVSNDRATIIGSNLDGSTAKEFSGQFANLYKIRAARGKAIPEDTARHFVLALPKGEKLTEEKWAELGQRFLEKMGYVNYDGTANTHYLIVRHTDKPDSDHIHIITSRLKFDGNLINNHFEERQAGKYTQHLAEEFGLSALPVKFDFKKNDFIVTLPEQAPDLLKKATGKMYAKKQAGLAKLSEVLKVDLSGNDWFAENTRFCSVDKAGKVSAKFFGNVTMSLTPTPEGTFKAYVKANIEHDEKAQELKRSLSELVALSATPFQQLPVADQSPADPNVQQLEGQPAAAMTVQVDGLPQQAEIVSTPIVPIGVVQAGAQPVAVPVMPQAIYAPVNPIGGFQAALSGFTSGADQQLAKLRNAVEKQGGDKPLRHSRNFPHLSGGTSPAPATPSLVDVGAITAGMDGSIIALLTQIAALESAMAGGNTFEAMNQRAKIIEQIKQLKAQVSALEHAEASAKNKNGLNKHNLPKVDAPLRHQPAEKESPVEKHGNKELMILALGQIIIFLEVRLEFEKDPEKREDLKSKIAGAKRLIAQLQGPALSAPKPKPRWSK